MIAFVTAMNRNPTLSVTTAQENATITREDFFPLLSALAHFSKTTNKFFYFYLEKAIIQESDDGHMQFGYEATDEEGSQKVFFVTIVGSELRLKKIKKLIAGVNRDGSEITGSRAEITNMYISAAYLLMEEIQKTNLPIGRIIYAPTEFGMGLDDVRENPKTGEFDVYCSRR